MIDFDGLNVGATIIALLFGAALGGTYFGALWLTVRHLIDHRYPEIVLIGSLIVRLGLVLTAFYLIVDGGHWVRLLAALAGFVIIRVVLLRTAFTHTYAPAPL